MTSNEAIKMVENVISKNSSVVSGREYEGFYAFFISSSDSGNGQFTFVGSTLFCVDKSTRKVVRRTIGNPELRGKRWKPINLKRR